MVDDDGNFVGSRGLGFWKKMLERSTFVWRIGVGIGDVELTMKRHPLLSRQWIRDRILLNRWKKIPCVEDHIHAGIDLVKPVREEVQRDA